MNINTIHEQEGDFLKVKHLRLSGTNEEIGFKLGEIAKNDHRISPGINKDHLRNECQKKYLKNNYSIHYDRMTGLAKTYSEDIEITTCDFTCFGNPISALGCSAVFYPPQNTETKTGILSRNLDLTLCSFSEMISGQKNDEIPATANMYVVELYPDKGFSSLVNLSFELYGLSLDGINSEGLTVTHLYADSVNSHLYEPTRTHGVGINEMLAVQLLLDKCKTVDEAKDVLLSNKHFYLLLPTHLLIADRFGKSFVWEYSPQHNREYIIDGGDQPQVITNFLLHEFKSSDEFPESKERACPFSRYKSIEDDMACDTIFSIEKIKEINSRVFISDDMFLKKPDPKERTIYHSLYDTNKRSMEISFYRKDEGKKELRTQYFEFQLT